MMKDFQVAYIPIGVPTYHLESAREQFDKSVKLLNSLADNVKVPKDLLLSIDDLDEFLDTISPDLIVLQNATFANAAYASQVLILRQMLLSHLEKSLSNIYLVLLMRKMLKLRLRL